MKKIDKRDIVIFILIFIFTLIVFHNFVTMHYATDTYNIINRGYREYALIYSLNDGRPIMCIISLLANFVNMPIEAYIIILTILALFISCITAMKLKSMISYYYKKENIKNEIILLITSYVVVFNFAYLENLQFAECLVMASSILLYTIAVDILIKSQKFCYIKSLLLVILAILCYQGTVSYLICLMFVFSLLKEKRINKEVVKKVLICGVWIVIGIAINLVQVRIAGHFLNMTQTRMGSIYNVIDNFKYILDNIKYILQNTFNLFPKNIMLLYIGVLVFTTVLSIRSMKDSIKFINVVLIFLVCIIATYIPSLSTLAGFGTGRMAFSIGASIGLIIIYLLCNIEKNKIKHILLIILISYFGLTIINYMYIMDEHKRVNLQDKQDCITIGKWIEEHEIENNITINNIGIVYDKNSNIYYSNIKNQSALCYRALYPEWSRIGAINYYNNRNFKEIKETKGVYYRSSYDKDWDNLNKEQLIFIDDTVYYCVY